MTSDAAQAVPEGKRKTQYGPHYGRHSDRNEALQIQDTNFRCTSQPNQILHWFISSMLVMSRLHHDSQDRFSGYKSTIEES